MTESNTPSMAYNSNHESSPTAAVTQNDNQPTSEPFPPLSTTPSPRSPRRPSTEITADESRSRGHSNTSISSLHGRLRSASKHFQESNPPTGMWIATGQIASSIPSLSDIRRGSFGSDGWSGQGQVIERERRASLSKRKGSQTSEEFPRKKSLVNPNGPRGQPAC